MLEPGDENLVLFVEIHRVDGRHCTFEQALFEEA